MRPEESPLDLNNLPEEHSERYKEGKQVLEESSGVAQEATDASRCRKKKSGKEGKEECEKIYECRFCSLKFCKSQALGGHMNRHRQERETETLNRARQLVFSNEGLAVQGPLLECNTQHTLSTNFHQRGGIGDQSMPYQSVYTRIPSATSSYTHNHPPQPHLYPSSSSLLAFQPPYPPPPTNDYYIGHVFGNTPYHHSNPNYTHSNTNYTCVGAPVINVGNEVGRGNWNCSNTDGQGLGPSSVDRFHDKF
ncbi:zinc finger protein STAMENLESS 1-like isoform X1 [Tasmannia lanceolata]|uniref:zinc finger protein STAMENLESS 1-like isoform X1 n=1 Tax=Tasmannia lanceolata TaxID=3420 RepID=UPI0040641100